MTQMQKCFDMAFTPSVTDVQEHRGVRDRYAAAAETWPVPSRLNTNEIEHITATDSLYLASVNESGWPYVQHRGGESGFVKVLDDHTIGWLERMGNRQYLSARNIAADDRVSLIIVDYPNYTRLKLFGHAVHHLNPSNELLAKLDARDLRGDGAVTIEVVSYDWNCPRYITPRFTAEAVDTITAPLHARIQELEAQLTQDTKQPAITNRNHRQKVKNMTTTEPRTEGSTPQSGETTEGEKYRFDRLSLPLIFADMRYKRSDPKAGDKVPFFELPTIDGGNFSSADLGDQPVLLFFGSITCPIAEASGPGLKELHSRYGDRVRFVAVNVREAHPGDKIEQPRTTEEKAAQARAFQAHHGFAFETAVDDIDGLLHRTLGPKPNSAYLIDPTGLIMFRAQWATDTRALDEALKAAVTGSTLPRKQVARTMPNIIASMGYIPEVLDRAGRRAHRDMWKTAPPMAAMALLTRAFGRAPRARRGWVAVAVIATAVVAAVVGFAL